MHAPPQGGGWVSWERCRVSAAETHESFLEDASAAAELLHMHTRVTIAHVYTAHRQAGGLRGAQSSEDSTVPWWWAAA